MPRLLVIDGTNQFIRHFMANTMLDAHDQCIGAVSGFLRGLGEFMSSVKPTEVVIAWDAPGGSVQRRLIFPGYKAGRKPSSPNIQKMYALTDDEVKMSKDYQTEHLLRYLDHCPVKQIIVDDCEADDVIAMMVQIRKATHEIVIVSADKDFFQLLDEGVIIYRPQQQEYITFEDVEKFGSIPENFALFRSLAGDASDKIPNVRAEGAKSGLGEKTIPKIFPILMENRRISLTDLKEYCEENVGGNKFYQLCLDQMDKIERNYKITQLYEPLLSTYQTQKILSQLDSYDGKFDYGVLMQECAADGFNQASELFMVWDEMRKLAKLTPKEIVPDVI